MFKLKEIKAGKATLVIITSMNLIVPGGLGLFLLRNEIFQTTDFAKLLLLSIMLSSPFLLFTFGLTVLFFEGLMEVPASALESGEGKKKKKRKKNGTESNDLSMILLTNIFFVIIWCVAGLMLWFDWPSGGNMAVARGLSLNFLWVSISFAFVILMLIIIKYLRLKKTPSPADPEPATPTP